MTERDVETHLSTPECIEAMRETMIEVSSGNVHLPIRQFMPIDGAPGKMAIMPGSIGAPGCFGVKLVCKYDRDPSSPYGTHVGMVIVFDGHEGLPLAMIEGASLTAIRTAAASALATDLLARDDARRLLVIGCGEQARRHVHAMKAVRGLEHVVVWGRDIDRAKAFADDVGAQENVTIDVSSDLEQSVRDADLICTTTSSKTPLLAGEWLRPGVHVNLVGSAIPSTAEADETCVVRSRFFVDYRPAAMAAAGELLNALKSGAITEDHIVAEIGDVAAGTKRGRTSDNDITVYKSLGVAAQDLATGRLLYDKATRLGFGTDVEMMDGPKHL